LLSLSSKVITQERLAWLNSTDFSEIKGFLFFRFWIYCYWNFLSGASSISSPSKILGNPGITYSPGFSKFLVLQAGYFSPSNMRWRMSFTSKLFGKRDFRLPSEKETGWFLYCNLPCSVGKPEGCFGIIQPFKNLQDQNPSLSGLSAKRTFGMTSLWSKSRTLTQVGIPKIRFSPIW